MRYGNDKLLNPAGSDQYSFHNIKKKKKPNKKRKPGEYGYIIEPRTCSEEFLEQIHLTRID